MWVKDYMHKDFCTISPEKTLEDAVNTMVENKVNSLIVVDSDDKPIGLVSTFILIKEVVPDYLKSSPSNSQFDAEGTFDKYVLKARQKFVKDFMFKDFHIIQDKDAMIEAAAYMVEKLHRTMPVVDPEGKIVGVISRTCVKIAMHDALQK